MKPRVVLRADAGSSIGFGHFVRTTALAAYLRDDFECVVATRNPDTGRPTPYQLSLIEEADALPSDLTGREREEFDAAFLDDLMPDDIVVLDNYYYPAEYQSEIRTRCRALVCIDDVHDRHFVSDVVMTFCPLDREDFSMEDYTRFYGGIKWSFLRQPFLAPARQRPSGTIRRIAMAMGGADPFGLTDRYIALLRRIAPDVVLDVLAGQTVRVSYQQDQRLHIWRQADAKTIAEIFDNADLGIFPASTVCVEAFSRRLPIAAGHYVDNQEEFYAYGVEHGWFAPLGCMLDDDAQIERRLAPILSADMPAPASDFDFRRSRREIINIFKSL